MDSRCAGSLRAATVEAPSCGNTGVLSILDKHTDKATWALAAISGTTSDTGRSLDSFTHSCRRQCGSRASERYRLSMRRRALRVSRPAREKSRRRRVLGARPERCARSRRGPWSAALAEKRPEGRWFAGATPYLRSRMAFSSSAWLVGLQLQGPAGGGDSCSCEQLSQGRGVGHAPRTKPAQARHPVLALRERSRVGRNTQTRVWPKMNGQ